MKTAYEYSFPMVPGAPPIQRDLATIRAKSFFRKPPERLGHPQPAERHSYSATRRPLGPRCLPSFSRKPLSTIAARIQLSATRNSELAAQAGLARQSNEIRTSIFSIN